MIRLCKIILLIRVAQSFASYYCTLALNPIHYVWVSDQRLLRGGGGHYGLNCYTIWLGIKMLIKIILLCLLYCLNMILYIFRKNQKISALNFDPPGKWNYFLLLPNLQNLQILVIMAISTLFSANQDQWNLESSNLLIFHQVMIKTYN